jgi:hypothetical protein
MCHGILVRPTVKLSGVADSKNLAPTTCTAYFGVRKLDRSGLFCFAVARRSQQN